MQTHLHPGSRGDRLYKQSLQTVSKLNDTVLYSFLSFIFKLPIGNEEAIHVHQHIYIFTNHTMSNLLNTEHSSCQSLFQRVNCCVKNYVFKLGICTCQVICSNYSTSKTSSFRSTTRILLPASFVQACCPSTPTSANLLLERGSGGF